MMFMSNKFPSFVPHAHDLEPESLNLNQLDLGLTLRTHSPSQKVYTQKELALFDRRKCKSYKLKNCIH